MFLGSKPKVFGRAIVASLASWKIEKAYRKSMKLTRSICDVHVLGFFAPLSFVRFACCIPQCVFHYEHGLSGTTRLSCKVQTLYTKKHRLPLKQPPLKRRGGVYHPCRYINGNPFPKKHTFQWHCS